MSRVVLIVLVVAISPELTILLAFTEVPDRLNPKEGITVMLVNGRRKENLRNRLSLTLRVVPTGELHSGECT